MPRNNSTSAFYGVISGSGGITKQGTGTLTMTTANDYAGGTTVSGGIIDFGATGTAGLGTITLSASTFLYYLLWVVSAPFWQWAFVSVLLGLGFG